MTIKLSNCSSLLLTPDYRNMAMLRAKTGCFGPNFAVLKSTLCLQSRTLASAASAAPPKLVCGLEIHTQLLTKRKLFSNTTVPSLTTSPNTKVSYFDAALPGTQPRLNPQALLLALKAAIALRCEVKELTAFDRKHYFYPDQPSGYQITQHRKPLAIKGRLRLNWYELFSQNEWPQKRQELGAELDETYVNVPITQIQLEQDTGKSTYDGNTTLVDLNRANMPLIEIITAPVIHEAHHASAFVKKLQTLLKATGVSTGEFESGAMRVDVNVSIGENGQRCEIKNLPNTSSIEQAIKAEYRRQVELVASGGVVEQATMGWDGVNTFKLRTKEDAVDYRYMPDPELPLIRLTKAVLLKVRDSLPMLPDKVFQKLSEDPYHVTTKDALTMIHTHGLADYYFSLFKYVQEGVEGLGLDKNAEEKALRAPANWTVNELVGRIHGMAAEEDIGKVDFEKMYPHAKLGDLILHIVQGKVTLPSAKLLFQHFLSNPQDLDAMTLDQAVSEFDLGVETGDVVDACKQVMSEHSNIVAHIADGSKPGSIKFLIGMVMKATQGRVNPAVIERTLKTEINRMS